MLKSFRVLSLIEGCSLITLFFFAMPAKYYFGHPEFIFPVGMTHGVLWLSYLIMSLIVSHRQGWSVGFWGVVLGASVVPFACFFLDRKLRSQPVSAVA